MTASTPSTPPPPPGPGPRRKAANQRDPSPETNATRTDAVRAERIRDQELTRQVLPYLVARYRHKVEPVQAAAEVETQFGLESRKAYRWTALMYEQLDRSRRRIATAFAGALWTGALLLLIPGIGALTGRFPLHHPPRPVVLMLTAGILLMVSGLTGGLCARRLARVPPGRSPRGRRSS